MIILLSSKQSSVSKTFIETNLLFSSNLSMSLLPVGKIDTIPVQNIIFQFIIVKHFLWMMFAYFVIDYGLCTIFEAFLVFVFDVDTCLF